MSIDHVGGLFSVFDRRMCRFRRGCKPCRETSRSTTVLPQVSAEASVPGFRSVQRLHPLIHSKKGLLTQFHDIKWSTKYGAEDLRLTAVPSCVLQNFRFPRTGCHKRPKSGRFSSTRAIAVKSSSLGGEDGLQEATLGGEDRLNRPPSRPKVQL